MFRQNHLLIPFIFFLLFMFSCSSSDKDAAAVAVSSDYTDLVTLFQEFRESQKQKIIDGIPDYTAATIEEQWRRIKNLQERLSIIDPSDWPISQQIDYLLVRTEMNGYEFQHRVLRPWSRNPGFYKTRPFTTTFKYKSSMYDSLGLPQFPLEANLIGDFRMSLQAIPKILKQAKENLTEPAADLAIIGIWIKKNESAILDDVTDRLVDHHPDLVPDSERAQTAVLDYIQWLEENINGMTAPAGIGKENYNWWLKNVHLFPYTWEDCLVIVQREYDKAIANLKLEEHRNRKLPPLEPVKTEEAFNRLWKQSEEFLLQFIRKEEILTVPDYLEPIGPHPFESWAANPGRQGTLLDFFEQIGDRDPMTEIIHNTLGHNFDRLQLQRDSRPIRGVRRRYGVNIRSEALAFGLEEMLMQTGLFDNRRRGREIVHIAVAFRAARALADLKMHSNDVSVKDALQNILELTPYGWAIEDGELWLEMETIYRTPGHHMGFIVGKAQLEKLMADLIRQQGWKFNLQKFWNEFLTSGMMPISLVRWEMTGSDDELKKLW